MGEDKSNGSDGEVKESDINVAIVYFRISGAV